VEARACADLAQLKRSGRKMQILKNLGDTLQACNSRDEAYPFIALAATELFPVASGALAVPAAGVRELLETAIEWDGESRNKIDWMKADFAIDDCWALRRGHIHEVPEPRRAVACRHFVTPPRSGYLCVPMTVQGDTLGILCLIGDDPKKGEIELSQAHVALAVGETIKLVLSNLKLRERLREQANHDPLTGLFNRRYLDDSLSRELSLSVRRGAPLSIAVLDVDHFKRFNDTFGHDAGDLALREASRVMSMNLRKSDIACRLGGEEFALVLPDSSLEDTRQRVEQICGFVKQSEIRHDGNLLGTITLSAGIAGSPDHATTARELLRAADVALFAAKRTGRERVVTYESAEVQKASERAAPRRPFRRLPKPDPSSSSPGDSRIAG